MKGGAEKREKGDGEEKEEVRLALSPDTSMGQNIAGRRAPHTQHRHLNLPAVQADWVGDDDPGLGHMYPACVKGARRATREGVRTRDRAEATSNERDDGRRECPRVRTWQLRHGLVPPVEYLPTELRKCDHEANQGWWME